MSHKIERRLVLYKNLQVRYVELNKNNLNGKSVTVGFSGGVDSTASVLLLKDRFEHVETATMWLYDGQENEFEFIERQAKALGVGHEIFDFREMFSKTVVDPYVSYYEQGLTPNPCVFCNKSIKYGLFLECIKTDYLALGHYSRKCLVDGEYRIYRSNTLRKDQSYNLYSLTQEQLARIIFPLSDFKSKEDVRKIAEPYLKQSTESMGTCFLMGEDRVKYFKELSLSSSVKGFFVDKVGNIICEHDGTVNYTIGQKPKIWKEKIEGVAATSKVGNYQHCLEKKLESGTDSPYIRIGTVVDVLPQKQLVVIGEEQDVMTNRIVLDEVNIISEQREKEISSYSVQSSQENPASIIQCSQGNANKESNFCEEKIFSNTGFRVSVRLSQWSEVYEGICWFDTSFESEEDKGELLVGSVLKTDDRTLVSSSKKGNNFIRGDFRESVLVVQTEKPMRAPAPGQAAVLYLSNELIGGGIIQKSRRK